MNKPNILLIMSDEHAPQMTGCYGHPIVQTPTLDRLAAEGAVFENAYTNCPICVPARASFMTGRYAHDIEVWDNDSAYSSSIPTIGSYFGSAGYETTLCGRTHFVGTDTMHGFDRRLFAEKEKWKHLGRQRAGDRSPGAQRYSRSHVTDCGPGPHEHLDYDQQVTDRAVQYLQNKARKSDNTPWLLYCGFINPHFPLICPERYFEIYYSDDLPLAKTRSEPLESQHPAIQQLRHWQRGESLVDKTTERKARAGYYGLITFMDDLIGRIMSVIDGSALKDDTVVIYVSDHGENAGEHGLWQKQCFYEHSVGIPFIVRAPEGPAGHRVAGDVSLVDVLPTLFGITGLRVEDSLPGRDLSAAIQGEDEPSGPVFGEYHTIGMANAGYMVKEGRYKYNYYVNHDPELYDLASDPEELNDASNEAEYASIRRRLNDVLHHWVDPEAIDQKAKSDQA